MKIAKSALRKMVFSDWRFFFGFGFGSGLLPKIPGTWGTLITVPLVILLSKLPIVIYVTTLIVIFGLGCWISGYLSERLGVHDYGGVNIDEVAGYLFTMLPFACSSHNLLLSFLLFRIFDMLKPFPVGWVDKHIHGGFGMMFDDIVAASMAILTLYAINTWIF
jgi:phosphatidylglycerophosphatase A